VNQEMKKLIGMVGAFFTIFLLVSSATAVSHTQSQPTVILLEKIEQTRELSESDIEPCITQLKQLVSDPLEGGLIDILIALIQLLINAIDAIINFILGLYNIVELVQQLLEKLGTLIQLIIDFVNWIISLLNPEPSSILA
jgi:phage-related protein